MTRDMHVTYKINAMHDRSDACHKWYAHKWHVMHALSSTHVISDPCSMGCGPVLAAGLHWDQSGQVTGLSSHHARGNPRHGITR